MAVSLTKTVTITAIIGVGGPVVTLTVPSTVATATVTNRARNFARTMGRPLAFRGESAFHAYGARTRIGGYSPLVRV